MANYRTKEQQLAICEAWKHSKLTQTEFCQQNNIKFYSLNRWLRNLRRNTVNSRKAKHGSAISNAQDIKFYPAGNPSIKPINDHNKSLIEIILPSGISFKAHLPEDCIKVYLRELLK